MDPTLWFLSGVLVGGLIVFLGVRVIRINEKMSTQLKSLETNDRRLNERRKEVRSEVRVSRKGER